MFQMLPITNVGLLPFTVNRKGFGGFVPLLVALARSVEHDFLENRSKVELDKPATNTFPWRYLQDCMTIHLAFEQHFLIINKMILCYLSPTQTTSESWYWISLNHGLFVMIFLHIDGVFSPRKCLGDQKVLLHGDSTVHGLLQEGLEMWSDIKPFKNARNKSVLDKTNKPAKTRCAKRFESRKKHLELLLFVGPWKKTVVFLGVVWSFVSLQRVSQSFFVFFRASRVYWILQSGTYETLTLFLIEWHHNS